ncbi:MAG: hypothetical protein J6U93_02015 [Alistipes sp.]|nr:hypothetical protein [Alistipes sp.]
MSSGGRRAGAGRKSLGENKKQTLAVRVSPEALRIVEEIAERQRVSKGVAVEALIMQQRIVK